MGDTSGGRSGGRSDGRSDTVGIDSLISQSVGIVLPPFQNEAFMSQRHEVNPALALNLLNDIQTVVITWQEQLRRLVHALRALIAQGPMVDGWLESSCAPEKGLDMSATGAEAALLRHGDADALMQYVEALEHCGLASEDFAPAVSPNASESFSENSPAQYRLCSLNADGTVRSQLCPPEQVAFVSTAIARYQKFKQLVAQKEAIEAKLQQAVNELTGVRARLQPDN